jgi:glycine hydroxymethyltransferase
VETVRSLVIRNTLYREHCLNLLAAENIPSAAVREVVGSTLMGRQYGLSQHRVDKRYQPGSGAGLAAEYIIEIEKILVDLSKTLFHANFVEYRGLNGTAAIQSAINAFTDPGDVVLELDKKDGGHGWCTRNPSKYKPYFFPFNRQEWNIDVDAAVAKIRELKPKLILTGASYYLFPQPVKDLVEAGREVGAVVAADEAHVLGLIGGKQWPNPLDENVDAMTGSTHKTLFGPIKGLALSNDKETSLKLADAMNPGFVANHGAHETAALAIALAEFVKFGEAYSQQTVRNAKVLAEALYAQGFQVLGESKGFTQSHQVLVDTSRYMPGAKAAELLENANILVNYWETKDFNGLRIGTAEPTRMGLKETEMKEVANYFAKVLKDKEDHEKIRSDVIALTHEFRDIHYSFDSVGDT